MALTRDFRDTVMARVNADPKFALDLLKNGIEAMILGDVDAGKAVLRDHIKATVGFEQLGIDTEISPKSLIRMFGPSGNPQTHNLFAVISQLQRYAGVSLGVVTLPPSHR